MKLETFRDPVTLDSIFRFSVDGEVLALLHRQIEELKREGGDSIGGAILVLAFLYKREKDRRAAEQRGEVRVSMVPTHDGRFRLVDR